MIVAESYVSDELYANVIKPALQNAFQTAKTLGLVIELTLYRDSNQDGVESPVVNTDVLVTFTAREPTRRSGDAVTVLEADGQFEREVPFDIVQGDTFRFEPTPPQVRGPSGTVGKVYPADEIGVVKALFSLGR